MKWMFWTLLLLSFLLINETTVHWVLAMYVGEYAVQPAFERATQFVTLNGLLFSSSFRVVPYVVLSAIAVFTNLKNSSNGKVAFWFSLASISIFHFWGYWGMQHSLYTSAHTSSTSALGIIFIPIHTIWLSAVSGALGFGLAKIIRLFLSRT